MMTGAFALAMYLMAATPAEVVVVNLPVKGVVSLTLAPSGKVDFDRIGTLSLIRIDIDKLQSVQKLSPAMNAYIVWAVSPEGGFENVGELPVVDGKGRMETTTRFDHFGILITAEPHYMVDRPNSVIAFRNQAPKSDAIRRAPVSVEVGTYDYSKLKPEAATVPGLVAQARAALQVASGAQADRYAEAEFRLAQITLNTLEEMLGRSTAQDILQPVANESIRRSQRSIIAARDNTAAAALETARNDATLLRRDSQQLQDRLQQLTNERASALDQVRQLNADLATSVRDKQQLTSERDAALTRAQGLERDVADLRRKQDEQQAGTAVKLPAAFFDISTGTATPAGVDALSKIAAAAALWSEPLRVSCPANAVEIVKNFLSVAGVPQDRFVIVPDR